MFRSFARRAIVAGLVAVSLAACSGGSTTPAPPGNGGSPGANLLSRIVGVGDSLTAGVQSNALLGVDIVPNPLGKLSPFPIVPNTQGHGFWALLWSQANGGANPLNPAISPIPLMVPPGLGSILLPTVTGGLTLIVATCQGPAAVATTYSTALQTRIAPTTVPMDLGVPGQTLREAIIMGSPVAPCNGQGLPSQFLPLNGIIQSEDTYLWPVLGNFPQGTTQLQAAVSLKPTLATVWLGNNDLLHYAFSNGVFPPTDPGQFQSDTVQVIQTLQKAGARVVISNLFDVLTAAQFTNLGKLPAYFTLYLAPYGVNQQQAVAAAQAEQAYYQATYAIGNGAFLTESGWFKSLFAVLYSLQNQIPLQQVLASPTFQLAAGDFVSDSVAANTQKYNNLYNAAIAAAAAQTHVPLVDNHAFLANVVANGGYIPYPGNPKCCSLFLFGGLTSDDGLHPSNSGYALIANNWISTIDSALGANIPQLSTAQLEAINAGDLYSPH